MIRLYTKSDIEFIRKELKEYLGNNFRERIVDDWIDLYSIVEFTLELSIWFKAFHLNDIYDNDYFFVLSKYFSNTNQRGIEIGQRGQIIPTPNQLVDFYKNEEKYPGLKAKRIDKSVFIKFLNGKFIEDNKNKKEWFDYWNDRIKRSKNNKPELIRFIYDRSPKEFREEWKHSGIEFGLLDDGMKYLFSYGSSINN